MGLAGLSRGTQGLSSCTRDREGGPGGCGAGGVLAGSGFLICKGHGGEGAASVSICLGRHLLEADLGILVGGDFMEKIPIHPWEFSCQMKPLFRVVDGTRL